MAYCGLQQHKEQLVKENLWLGMKRENYMVYVMKGFVMEEVWPSSIYSVDTVQGPGWLERKFEFCLHAD